MLAKCYNNQRARLDIEINSQMEKKMFFYNPNIQPERNIENQFCFNPCHCQWPMLYIVTFYNVSGPHVVPVTVSFVLKFDFFFVYPPDLLWLFTHIFYVTLISGMSRCVSFCICV